MQILRCVLLFFFVFALCALPSFSVRLRAHPVRLMQKARQQAAAAAHMTVCAYNGYFSSYGNSASKPLQEKIFNVFQTKQNLPADYMQFNAAANGAFQLVHFANTPEKYPDAHCDLIGSDSAMEALIVPNYLDNYNVTTENLNVYLQPIKENIDWWNMFPIAWSPLAFVFDHTRIPSAATRALISTGNFTLENLLTSGVLSHMMMESPISGVLGLDMLLWSVAEYGDPYFGVVGKVQANPNDWSKGNWEQFWERVMDTNVTFVNKIEDLWQAFTDSGGLLDQSGDYVGYFGYGTDCSFLRTTTNTTAGHVEHDIQCVGSTIGGTTYSWVSTEGLAILSSGRTAAQLKTAEDFVNFFLSNDMQTLVGPENYMEPVRNNFTLFPNAPGGLFNMSAGWYGAANLEKSWDTRMFQNPRLEMMNSNFKLDPHRVRYYLAKWQTLWLKRKYNPVVSSALNFDQPQPLVDACATAQCPATGDYMCLNDFLSARGYQCVMNSGCDQSRCTLSYQVCVLRNSTAHCITPSMCLEQQPCPATMQCQDLVVDRGGGEKELSYACIAISAPNGGNNNSFDTTKAAILGDSETRVNTHLVLYAADYSLEERAHVHTARGVLGGALLITILVVVYCVCSRGGRKFLATHVVDTEMQGAANTHHSLPAA